MDMACSDRVGFYRVSLGSLADESRPFSVPVPLCLCGSLAQRGAAVLVPDPQLPPWSRFGRPIVEPFSRLPAQLAVAHLLPQDRRRLEMAGVQLDAQVLGNGEPHIEADQIADAQWTHGMAVA